MENAHTLTTQTGLTTNDTPDTAATLYINSFGIHPLHIDGERGEYASILSPAK